MGTQGYCAEHYADLVNSMELAHKSKWDDADDDLDEWGVPIPLGDAEDRPMFPVEALPGWMADYASAVADEMQVAVDLPAVLALVAMSIATTGRYRIEVMAGAWTEPTNIYAVVALPPSAGKSPVVKKMLGPVQAREIEMRRDAIDRQAHVDQKRRMIEKAMKRAEDKGDMGEAQRCLSDLLAHPPLVIPRIIADDATPEALTQLLHDQDGRIALISTEGGPFDIMAGRYSDRANLDVYLKAWSGDPLSVDRIGRPAITITQPLMVVGLTVQPSVIIALATKDEFRGRGLTSRFMYSVPADNVGGRDMFNQRSADPRLADTYQRSLMAHIGHQMLAEPTLVTIEPDADLMQRYWRQDLEYRKRPEGDLRPMTEWVSKMEATTIRVAGLLAIADGAPSISADVMARAITIGEYWLMHAKIVHDMWQVDDRIGHARAILAWAAERELDSFSVRDVYASLRKRFPTADDTREPLNLLTERGWLAPMFDGPLILGRRGKDSPEFRVHPQNRAKSASHARHVDHVLKAKFETLSSSSPGVTDGRNSAHDAHEIPTPLDDVDNFSVF